MRRISIDPHEVAEILNRKISTAQKLLRTIRDVYGKQKHQSVTIKEFCEYQDLPFEDIFNMINKIEK